MGTVKPSKKARPRSTTNEIPFSLLVDTATAPPLAEIQAALNQIPAHTWYAVSSGAIAFLNKRCADYLGLPKDHPLRFGSDSGAEWDSHIPLLHPDDHEETRRVWSTCLRAGSAGQMSFRLRNAEGGYRWFLSRAEPIRGSDGTLLYWIGVNLDIDDRKRAEEELRTSESKYRNLVDTTPAFVHTALPNGDVDFFNHGWLEYLGVPITDLLGWRWTSAIHPEDVEALVSKWRASIESGDPFVHESRVRRADGEYRWLLHRKEPLRNELGAIVKWYGSSIEIEERKIAEEKIREQEMELTQILDLTPQLVVVLGPNRERLYANRGALDYLGLSLDEWRERSIGDEIHPDDLERLGADTRRALSKDAAFELELRVRKGDGSYRWFLARYNPVHSDNGQIMQWYTAWTDIEDRKIAEERLQQENIALREEVDKASMFEEIVGESTALRSILVLVAKVAPTESTVLITGETGTGKELIARAIHKRSNRSKRAFVAVNCAAIPEALIASELFGHEKGSFTGAMQRRVGKFEAAEGGTIFLDEVGDLPAETQVALLRVLQEHEFERVGGNRPIPSNVRVVAATNRDLEAAIAAAEFRSDLYYRLNVFPIEIPPLRERKPDIPLLAEYFIDRYSKKAGKRIRGISKKTLDLLISYHWPGNIRELQNVIERSLIVSESENFTVDCSWLVRGTHEPQAETQLLSEKLKTQEKSMIESALAESRGRVAGPSGAAAKLGMPVSTLESKIKSLKIAKHRFKPD